MTTQPSREIYAVNVPNATLDAKFVYNFFVTDESINDSGAVPNEEFIRNTDSIDSSFLQLATTRIPRMIVLNWNIPYVFGSSTSTVQYGSLIKDNFSSIINEDLLHLSEFTSLTFHDGTIDTKLYDFVSGSQSFRTLTSDSIANLSTNKAAASLNAATPNNITQTFLSNAFANTSKSSGTTFYSDENADTQIDNGYFSSLKKVTTSLQINNRLMKKLLTKLVGSPASPFAKDVVGILNTAAETEKSINFSIGVSENDFKTTIPYYDIKVTDTAAHRDNLVPEIVGYVIDKLEVLKTGETVVHDSIIIDNPKTSMTVDLQIKYNATYVYSIRTIMSFTIPAIDIDTNQLAFLKSLISSRQSNKAYVSTVDQLAPPPPADFDVTWNYQNDELFLTWAFPVNSQRDIKQFQVFKRASIKQPFQLLKMYDFDDSEVKLPRLEHADPRLVETITSPFNVYVDHEFDKNTCTNEKNALIYAIASIDAHGLTSCYSTQYKVWFNTFLNKIEKRLVSHQGAPKPYPNMFLEHDLFIDSIRIQGVDALNAKLYFNPEFYYLTDTTQKLTQVYQTKQTNGTYKINFINLDNQKSKIMTITIDDQTSMSQQLKNGSTLVGKLK